MKSYEDIIEGIYQSVQDQEKAQEMASFLRAQQGINKDTVRLLKKQKHDLATIFEIANQINAKSLDLEQLESFIRKMIMGQFLVSTVCILRQEQFDSLEISLRSEENSPLPALSFTPESELGQWIIQHPEPFLLDQNLCQPFEPLLQLKNAGIFLAVPLLKPHKQEGSELKGLLTLGQKLTKLEFTSEELLFLKFLAEMIAISLHNCQLYHSSIMDGLTKVYTRGYFDVHLAQEVNRIRRYGIKNPKESRYVSLVMLDIDHFKRLNDTYGHPFGDQVLKTVAQILISNIRTVDCVSRYGGEEFAVIFPETNKEQTLILAHRLREALAAHLYHKNGSHLQVTASLGVATYPDDAEDFRNLVLRADQALYQAKESGRNNVIAS